MKSPLISAALAALVAVPAAAQQTPCGDAEFLRDLREFSANLKQNPVALQQGGAKPAPAPKCAAGLGSALTAMRDGVTVGGQVTTHLDDQKIKVECKTQASASARSADGKAITLSDALPGAPRVLAPYIAREAAEALLADIPASGEREYMRLSLMTRVWLQLGGETAKLPAIETIESIKYEDAALAADFRAWIGSFKAWSGAVPRDASAAAKEAAKRAKLPTLAELKGKAKDASEKAKIAAAQKRFDDFTAAELEWYLLNQGTTSL